MSQTNFKYNPDEMTEEQFLSRFVVRGEIFDEIFEELQVADYSIPNQHHILIGQRGQGKTTLLRKLKLAVEQDKKLNKFLIPVKFSEEQYRIRELARLWEEVAEYLQTYHEDLFPDIHNQLETHFEDENYATKCFGYLEKIIKKSKKKILLLIDNIDIIFKKFKDQEQHRFREILLTSSSFIIVGASTKMFEQQYDYSKPFYEFFKLLHLSGLNSQETIKLLKVLGNKNQTKKINKIIKENPARIETLRTVTGGVPRTIVMLFDIFVEDNGNAFNDLRKVLDEVSPLYLARMDMSEIHQDIVHTIALNWDGMLTKDIAKKTRLASKVVSAQLKLLEKHQIIESISLGKNKLYQVKERFFNIWYLMRYGRKKDRDRVEWLIKFLLSWYDRNELKNKAKTFIERLSEENQNESYVYHFGEALCYTGLDIETDHKVKQSMKNYFRKHNSSFEKHVSQSDYGVIKKALSLSQHSGNDKAISLLIESRKESSTIFEYIALFSLQNGDSNKAEEYFLKAIKNGSKNSLWDIGNMYHYQRKINRAIKYYKKAINNDVKGAIFSLTYIYFEQAIELNNALILIKKLEKSFYNTHTSALINLWAEDFSNSYLYFKEWLQYDNALDSKEDVTIYLNLLMAKGQYYQAKEFFEMPQYQLKERYKPLWYALMTLMQDDFPHEIKKMGSELKQTVDEILAKIEKLKQKYAID